MMQFTAIPAQPPKMRLEKGEKWAIYIQTDSTPLVVKDVRRKTHAVRVLNALRKSHKFLRVMLGTTNAEPGAHYERVQTSRYSSVWLCLPKDEGSD